MDWIVGAVIAVLVIGIGAVVIEKKRHKSEDVIVNTNTNNLPNVIITQDTWDSDNPTMFAIADKAHNKVVNVLAYGVTGRDTRGHNGTIVSAIINSSIPIIVDLVSNTRSTPTSIRLRPEEFTADTRTDSQRPSIKELASIIMASSGNITYATGGHLHILARLMREYPETLSKIGTVVIGTGWNKNKNGKAEMNLAQGVNTPTGTSKDSDYVVRNLPKSIKVVFPSMSTFKGYRVPLETIQDNKLRTIISRGAYADGKTTHLGDFFAVVYGLYHNTFFSTVPFKEVECSVSINTGKLTIKKASGTNRFYLEKTQADGWYQQLFSDLVNRK